MAGVTSTLDFQCAISLGLQIWWKLQFVYSSLACCTVSSSSHLDRLHKGCCLVAFLSIWLWWPGYPYSWDSNWTRIWDGVQGWPLTRGTWSCCWKRGVADEWRSLRPTGTCGRCFLSRGKSPKPSERVGTYSMVKWDFINVRIDAFSIRKTE